MRKVSPVLGCPFRHLHCRPVMPSSPGAALAVIWGLPRGRRVVLQTEEELLLPGPSISPEPASHLSTPTQSVLYRQGWQKLQVNWRFTSVGLPMAQSERAEALSGPFICLRFTEPC